MAGAEQAGQDEHPAGVVDEPVAARRSRRPWLLLAVGIALVVVAAVVVITHQPSGTAAASGAATPGPFESTAQPVPCPGSTGPDPLRCFPIGDLQQDVVTPLTASGFRCIPGTAKSTLCLSRAAGVVVQVWPESVQVELPVVVGIGTEPDAVTGLQQITDAMRVVLRLLMPHSPNAQKSFLQPVQDAARKPGLCPELIRDGHGYGWSCFGHPAPQPVMDGIDTAIVTVRIYAVGSGVNQS
ncbi:MAG TPA: hypothetical protein VGD84_20060 [Pseudonocardiaceae bacterium]